MSQATALAPASPQEIQRLEALGHYKIQVPLEKHLPKLVSQDPDVLGFAKMGPMILPHEPMLLETTPPSYITRFVDIPLKELSILEEADRIRVEVLSRVQFDDLYFVEELTEEAAQQFRTTGILPVGSLLPVLPEPKTPIRTSLAQAGSAIRDITVPVGKGVWEGTKCIPPAVGKGLWQATKVAAPVVGMAALGAVALPFLALAGIASALGELDPILIGVISESGEARPGERAMAYQICAWRYKTQA